MNRETFALSQKELQRVAVISRCVKGELACARAAGLLGLSERQIKRLNKRLREDGEAALAHASRFTATTTASSSATTTTGPSKNSSPVNASPPSSAAPSRNSASPSSLPTARKPKAASSVSGACSR